MAVEMILCVSKYFSTGYNIHTYIIGHYNPSVRIIDLVSYTTLYISGGTYSLKSTPNDRFFVKTFHGSFNLLSEFLPEIC